MPQLSYYCKAYAANELREFPKWAERVPPLLIQPEPGTEEEMRTEYYFLHDNYIVRAGVYQEDQIVFDEVTPSWKSFCETVLHFTPPS